MKVLLVEDDLIVQHVHRMMLSKLGCEVDIAANGEAALQKMREVSNYNIVFVDIGLPDMSGFELIKKMRDENQNAIVPIIALTGYVGVQEKQNCFDSGATDIAYKPIVNSQLKEILEQYK